MRSRGRPAADRDPRHPGQGRDAKAKPILDPAFYQAFSSRLDKSVFFLNEKL